MKKMIEELRLPQGKEQKIDDINEKDIEALKVDENDFNVHDLDREEGLGDENEKKLEDNRKEVEKELADRQEKVEKEINNAEAKKPELKTGDNKKFVIKGLKEGAKLTLEEPTDLLNENLLEGIEDLDVYTKLDVLQTEFDIDAQAILDHIISWLPMPDLNNCINDFIVDNNMEDLFEDFKDSSFPRLAPLEEALNLDEKTPNDLLRAYKVQGVPHGVDSRSSFRQAGIDHAKTDWEKANYEEVSPQEGFKLYKQDPTSIRLMFNPRWEGDKSHYVDFRDNGYVSVDHRLRSLPTDKVYTNKKGNRIYDTARMPIKHLFNVADKIYHTDERTALRDPDLLAKRAENPESPNTSFEDTTAYDLWGDRPRGYYQSYNDSEYYEDVIRTSKEYIKELKDKLDRGDISNDYYSSEVEKAKDTIKSFSRKMMRNAGEAKDYKARTRYLAAANKLREPFNRYRKLKTELEDTEYKLNSAEAALEKVKERGAPTTARAKERYKELMDQMKELRRRIALCELDLEDTDEEDTAALKDAEDKVEAIRTNIADLASQMKLLLRKA